MEILFFQTPLGPIGGLKPALPPLKKLSPLGAAPPTGPANSLNPLQKPKLGLVNPPGKLGSLDPPPPGKLGSLEPPVKANKDLKPLKGELKPKEVKKVTLFDENSDSTSHGIGVPR